MTTGQKAMVGYGVAMIAMGVKAYFFPTGEASIMSLIGAGGVGLIVLILGVLASKASVPRWYYTAGMVFAVIGCSRFISKIGSPELTLFPGWTAIMLSIALIAILGMGHVSSMKAKKAESAE